MIDLGLVLFLYRLIKIHPVLLLLLSYVVFLAVFRRWPRWTYLPTHFAPKVAMTFVAAVAVELIHYVLTPSISGTHLMAVAFRANHGQPIYHSLDSPFQYSMLYGPVRYLLHSLVFRIVGPGVLAPKLVGAVLIFLTLGMVFLNARVHVSRATATVLVGTVALGLLENPVSTRNDSFLVLCTAVGIAAAGRWPLIPSALTVGAATILATHVKIHGALYLFPALVKLWQRHGTQGVLVAVGTALAGAPLPFLLPTVSFKNYLVWLSVALRHGLNPGVFLSNVEHALMWSIPLLVGISASREKRLSDGTTLNALALGISALAVGVVAAKPGAGYHHYLPLLPALVDLISRVVSGSPWLEPLQRPQIAAAALAFLVVVGAIALGSEVRLVMDSTAVPERKVIAELREIHRAHPGATIAMGYTGSGYPNPITSRHAYYLRALSNYFLYLVFWGHPLVFDLPSLVDRKLAGIELSPSSRRMIEEGYVDLWVLPKGGNPFDVSMDVSFNWIGLPSPARIPGPPLFDAQFRNAFARYYRKIDSGRFYDVYAYVDSSNSP